MVVEAEDSASRIWALKRVQGGSQSIREAERMVKLCNHPLIAQLQSVFVDGQAVYLQMPYYRHGNLRVWFEQTKVCLDGLCRLCEPVQRCLDLHDHCVVVHCCSLRFAAI